MIRAWVRSESSPKVLILLHRFSRASVVLPICTNALVCLWIGKRDLAIVKCLSLSASRIGWCVFFKAFSPKDCKVLVTPEKAETTMIKGSVCFFTICTTRCKFSTDPTEEPPNLISNIYLSWYNFLLIDCFFLYKTSEITFKDELPHILAYATLPLQLLILIFRKLFLMGYNSLKKSFPSKKTRPKSCLIAISSPMNGFLNILITIPKIHFFK